MRQEDKAGLRITIIFHLVVVIVLLLFGIKSVIQDEHSFLMDVSREELEALERQRQALQDEVNRKLDGMISAQSTSQPIRNVTVNGSLKDDRNSSAEAEKLYSDARALDKELKAGKGKDWEAEAAPEEDSGKSKKKKEETKPYSGPSVLSWTLEGRKAARLPIPAYRCYGEGQVTVFISVDRNGKVVSVKIDEPASSQDKCLQDFALRAARLSRFNPSDTAPSRQGGTICYSFIAQ